MLECGDDEASATFDGIREQAFVAARARQRSMTRAGLVGVLVLLAAASALARGQPFQRGDETGAVGVRANGPWSPRPGMRRPTRCVRPSPRSKPSAPTRRFTRPPATGGGRLRPAPPAAAIWVTGDLDPMHARGEDWRTGADVAITVTGSDGTDAGAGEAKLSTSARSFLAWLPPDGRLAAGEYIVRLA